MNDNVPMIHLVKLAAAIILIIFNDMSVYLSFLKEIQRIQHTNEVFGDINSVAQCIKLPFDLFD